MFGIGYNAKKIKNREIDLDLLFSKRQIISGQVGMTDEPREAIFLASQYLDFDLNHLGLSELKKHTTFAS